MPTIVKVIDGIESTQATAAQYGFIGWSPNGPALRALSTSRSHAEARTPSDAAKQHYRGGAGQGDPATAAPPA
jgi:hypothetical protein